MSGFSLILHIRFYFLRHCALLALLIHIFFFFPFNDQLGRKANLKQMMIRIKYQRNKTINHIQICKKEVAELLKQGKDESARIKVENIIREDYLVEAFELLQLFCDLIQSRLQLISECR